MSVFNLPLSQDKAQPYIVLGANGFEFDVNIEEIGFHAEMQAAAMAAEIVTAVNHHEALVEAGRNLFRNGTVELIGETDGTVYMEILSSAKLLDALKAMAEVLAAIEQP